MYELFTGKFPLFSCHGNDAEQIVMLFDTLGLPRFVADLFISLPLIARLQSAADARHETDNLCHKSHIGLPSL